jgi:hypothetical protein
MAQYQKNFLPSQAQPWVRQIQDKLTNVESAFRSSEVNNRSRDEQLLASYNRLDKAFIQVAAASSQALSAANAAQSAADAAAAAALTANGAAATANGIIDNIYVSNTEDIDGSVIASGTISVDKIIAGTLTGFTIQTASFGRRVILSGTNASFYDEGGNFTGSISGSGSDRASSVQVVSSTGSALYVYNGGADLVGPGSLISAGNAGAAQILINSSRTDIQGLLVGNASWNTSGNLTVQQRILGSVGTFNATTTSAANLEISSSGNFSRSTAASSRLVKRNIRELDFNLKDFLSIRPVVFNYNEGFITDEDPDNPEDVIGFIAEDFQEAGLGDLLIAPPAFEGDTISVKYNKLYMLLHKAVQEINQRLEKLEGENE